MLRNLPVKALAISIFALLFVLFPAFVHDNYYLHILITISLQLILVTSLFLIFTTGQMSVAHAAFMAIGAYTSALLVTRLGFNFWLALPVAGIMAAILAAIVGYPTLRLGGVYFFLVTFAFGQVVVLTIGHVFEDVFGGVVGLTGIPVPNSMAVPGLPQIDFAGGRIPYYYLAVLLMFASVAVIYRIYRSRTGMTFRAIATSGILAEHMGINLLRYKILAFSSASFFAGLVGAYYAHYHYVIVPADFGNQRSLHIIILMVVGGMVNFAGPMIGTPILTLAYELLNAYPYYREILFGVVLLVVMMFLRGGLVTLPERLAWLVGRLRALRGGKEEVSTGESP